MEKANANADRRHHEGRYRHRRHCLEYSGADLRSEIVERELVFLACDVSAGDIRSAAYPSNARRVHLPLRGAPRSHAGWQGRGRAAGRSRPDADEYSAWHLQQVGSDGEMLLLGFAHPPALRFVLGDPFDERTETGRGGRAVRATRGKLPATACVTLARIFRIPRFGN